jgi:hypothetical protein
LGPNIRWFDPFAGSVTVGSAGVDRRCCTTTATPAMSTTADATSTGM